MLYNLWLGLRSLRKRLQYSIINLLGLSIAISGCMFIAFYVQDERSFDGMFEDRHRIYKMVLERKYPDRSVVSAMVPHSMVSAMAKDLPDVDRATAICGPFDESISFKRSDSVNISLLEGNVYAADSNFLKVFSFRMLSGNRNTALSEPRTMVLTVSVAKKYFGDEDALGRSVHIGRDHFVVTGVCQDPPLNSHFNFTVLTSIQSIERFNLDNYSNADVHCYIKTREQAQTDAMAENVARLIQKYARPEIEELNKTSWESFTAAGNSYRYTLKPLTKVHLDPDNISGMRASGSEITLNILTGIGVLIFIIACVNFVNLTTALSIQRSKEVAVRKILGSGRVSLFFQFLTESLLLGIVSMVIALVMVYAALPYLNGIVGKNLILTPDSNTILLAFALVAIVTLMGGVYPALMLSSFKAFDFKIHLSRNNKANWLRNALVTFQFWISIGLAICLLVMIRQIRYIETKDLGFDKENLLMVRGDFFRDPAITGVLLEELEKESSIIATSGSLSMPTLKGIYDRTFKTDESADVKTLSVMYVADRYDKVMDLDLLDGQFFSSQANDSNNVVLNQTAVRALGLKDPVGKTVTFIEQTYGTGEETKFTIIGVVQDFNFQTLHNEVRPLVLHSTEMNYNRMSYILCRISPGDHRNAIAAIETKWKQHQPDKWFQYRFLDEALDSHYRKEQSQVKIILLFSALSVFISCVGLFGLSAFIASVRMREIAIRKVTGARSRDIMMMLLSGITKTVVISFVAAVPAAIYVVDNYWLQNFAFKVGLDIVLLGAVGIGALAIAWSTVAYQTFRASMQNPVEVLRSE